MAIRRALRPAAAGVLVAVILGVVAVLAAHVAPLPGRLASAGSQVVLWRDGTPAHVFLAPDDRWRIPVHVAEVDPDYTTALVRLEDKRFHSHLGVDLLAIARAMVLNLQMGSVVSGGSTITMQLVRLLEPRPRTLRSKVIEAARAVQLELRLSKAEILAGYLQFTPYGRNVEGIEAAALAYFGHRADMLAPGEIATLLAVPQNPNVRYPAPDHEDRLRVARNDIAHRLLEAGALPLADHARAASAADVLAEIEAESVPTRLRPMPRDAAHAALWIRDRQTAPRIRTTLQAGVQDAVTARLLRGAPTLHGQGIHNAAVVVLDRHTREVLALAGNLPAPDGSIGDDGGWIAAFDVPRSPGSALKPFITAMAIDGGHALPDFLVRDVPAAYGAWAPRNYDGGFDGLVRLDDALSRSLNLPFVALLKDVGIEPFLGALRQMGARSLVHDPGHYGLSVAVGGIEITPLELAGMYATLAEGGLHIAPRWTPSGEPASPTPILSSGSTWMTRKILSRRDRPDFPRRREMGAAPAHIHWKTGTSSGRRDAWAVGSGPHHTVAVWVGNLDNAGSVHIVGGEAAGPILFDVLESLHDRRRPVPIDPIPSGLRPIPVCAYSGHPPSAACPRTVSAQARVERVPVTACPFHVQRDVDRSTGLAVRPDCQGDAVTESRSFISWPASVRRFVSARHRQLPEPPSWAPGCAPPRRDREPTILNPPAHHVALLIPGMPRDKQQIPLEAEAPGDARLSWFVNGSFLGTVGATERLWWTPEPGEHEVVVTDESGRLGKRTFAVRAGR